MKKSGIKTIIGFVAFALIAAVLASLPALVKNNDSDELKPSILSTSVEKRELVKRLYSGGALSAAEEETLTVPSGVEISSFLVVNGDMVKAGDPIAEVNRLSVMEAVAVLREAQDSLKSEINQYWYTKIGVYTLDDDGNIYIDGNLADSDALGNTAELAGYIEQHNKCDEQMLSLFEMYRSGTVNATTDGMVNGLSRSALTLSSGQSGKISLLATNTPTGTDDDLSYTCYVGIVDKTDGQGLSMLMNPTSYTVDDFSVINVSKDMAAMTEPGTYTGGASIFINESGEWSLYGSPKSGDVLLFCYTDNMLAWIICIQQSAPEPTPSPEPSTDDGERPSPGGNTGGAAMPDSSGFSMGTGTNADTQSAPDYTVSEKTLCSIIPMDEMSISAIIDEQDIASIFVGQAVTLTFDALPGRSFEGEITDISTVGDNNGGSSKFEFVITLPYSDGMLPGMNASVMIDLERTESVLTVPIAALCEDNGRISVYTGYDEKEELLIAPVFVETGYSDGEYAEISSGLSDGQAIFYEYYDKLPSYTPSAPKGISFGFRR